MNLVSPNGISSVDWMRRSLAAHINQPLTWYKVNDFVQVKYVSNSLKGWNLMGICFLKETEFW